MTIIAFDGKTIASDSQISDTYVEYNCKKIFKINNSYIGTVGDYSEGLKFIRWFKDQMTEKPELSTEGFSALQIIERKVYYWDAYLIRYLSTIPCAIGSGDCIAMGAMLAGANAKEAVKITIKLDKECGGRIQAYEV